MSRTKLLPAVGSALVLAAAVVVVWSRPLKAEDKPPIKIPAPTKPLPPAKPTDPLKPQDPPKPRGADRTGDAAASVLVGPAADKPTRAALGKKVSLDFADAPVQKVVDSLAEQTKLGIAVVPKDGNTTADAQGKKVTIHVAGITAASALDLIARDLGWKWFADPGTITLTDDDQLRATVQVYNVRDLVLAHPGGGQDENLDYEYSPLADVITGSISSGTWSPDGGSLQDCSPFHGTLTITQDERVQEKIAGLLAALRRSRDLTPQQDAVVRAGLAIENADETGIEAALAKKVTAQPTAAKLDDLAAWIAKSYGISVHVDAKAREAGLPNTAIADTGPPVPSATAKPDALPAPAVAPPAANTNQDDSAKPAPAAKADARKPALTVSPAAPVNLVGMALEQALEALFADSNLGFTVRDEVLLITTKDEAKALRSVRVYPVGDLIDGEIDKDGVDEEYARLLDVITKAVEPDTWATLDKPKAGTAYISYLPQGRAIVCANSRSAQHDVAEMLDKVRAAIAEQSAAAAPSTPNAPSTPKPARPLSTKIYKLLPDLPADDFVAVVKDLVEPRGWTGDAYIHGVPGAIIVKQNGVIQKRVEKMLIDLGAITDPKKSPPSGTPTLVGRRKRV